MKKAQSVLLADLTANVKAAVAEVRKENPTLFDFQTEISFVPNPGIIGFILQEATIKDRSFGEVSQLAKLVGKKVKPLARGKPANILVQDGNIVVGFFPATDVLTL